MDFLHFSMGSMGFLFQALQQDEALVAAWLPDHGMMGWEQHGTAPTAWLLVTQEIGLFALAASRVGAQSPKISDFGWDPLSPGFAHFFFVGLFPLSSTTMVNIFFGFSVLLISGSAVQQRLCPSCSFWDSIWPRPNTWEDMAFIQNNSPTPQKLDCWNILRHLETVGKSWRYQGGPGACGGNRGCGHRCIPCDGALVWQMAMEMDGISRIGPLDPRKILGKSSEKREVLLFGLEGCRGWSWKSWTCLGVLNNWADWGWWSLALQMHKLRTKFCFCACLVNGDSNLMGTTWMQWLPLWGTTQTWGGDLEVVTCS